MSFVSQMEANPVSEVGAVLARVAALQASGAAARSLGARLAPQGARAEHAQDKLDALHMILAVQARRVSASTAFLPPLPRPRPRPFIYVSY